MRLPIRLTEVEPEGAGRDSGSVNLRFRFGPRHPDQLQALREARRSMLREESTLGAIEGEPRLFDATFAPFEISWRVPVGAEVRCRERLTRLVWRANRLSLNSPAPA